MRQPRVKSFRWKFERRRVTNVGLRQTSEFVLLKIKPCRPLSAAGKAREKNLKMFFQERSFAFEVDDFFILRAVT